MGHILLLFVRLCDTCQNLQEDLQGEKGEYEPEDKTENWTIIYPSLKMPANQNWILCQQNNNFKSFLHDRPSTKTINNAIKGNWLHINIKYNKTIPSKVAFCCSLHVRLSPGGARIL